MGCRLFGIDPSVDELCRGGGYRQRLVQPVFLGKIQTAADRECDVQRRAGYIGNHSVIALIACIYNCEIRDAQTCEDLRNQIFDDTGHLPLFIRSAVGQIVFQITDVKRIVRGQPCLFRRGKGARRNADRVIFCTQRIKIIRLLQRELGLCSVQALQQVRPLSVDAQVIVGSSERKQDLQVVSSVGAVSFRGEQIQLPRFKILKQRGIVIIHTDFGRDVMLLQVPVQRIHHRAVQHADLSVLKGSRIDGYIIVGDVPDQVVGLIAHRQFRVADQVRPLFPVGKSRQQIDLAVQEHLIKIAEFSVYILIFPAGVLGDLPIVLIGIALLDRAFRSAFLEHLIFVIADPDRHGLVIGIFAGSADTQSRQRQEKNHCAQKDQKSAALSGSVDHRCVPLFTSAFSLFCPFSRSRAASAKPPVISGLTAARPSAY